MSDYNGLTATPVYIVPLSETKKGGDPDGWSISGFPAIPVLGATAETISSVGASAGEVLTADGAGGASWEAGGVSFPLLAPNGTAGAPSYSFTNDTDTGVRLSAVGTLAFPVGGTDRVSLSTSNFVSTVPLSIDASPAFRVGDTGSSRFIGTFSGGSIYMTGNNGGEGTWTVTGASNYTTADALLGWSASPNNPSTAPDTALIRQAAGIIALTDGSTGGAAMLFREQSTPTGVTDAAIVYADVLATKTRLMVIFQTGAAIPLATEA